MPDRAAQWVKLSAFASIYGGSVPTHDVASTELTTYRSTERVLPPSLLTRPLTPVDDLPIRNTRRNPPRRLREGDLVGRNLAKDRIWTVLPASYSGVQPGQGLVVVQPLIDITSMEYIGAYLSSPQGEASLPLNSPRPSVSIPRLHDLMIPLPAGNRESIRVDAVDLVVGHVAMAEVVRNLDRALARVFEDPDPHEIVVRLQTAASLSREIADSFHVYRRAPNADQSP
jgi:type I restriction enzyme M protein